MASRWTFDWIEENELGEAHMATCDMEQRAHSSFALGEALSLIPFSDRRCHGRVQMPTPPAKRELLSSRAQAPDPVAPSSVTLPSVALGAFIPAPAKEAA